MKTYFGPYISVLLGVGVEFIYFKICDHYNVITLLEAVLKKFASLLNRPSVVIPELQIGFSLGLQSTWFFLLDKFKKNSLNSRCLNWILIELTKVSDTVNREALWVILWKVSGPPVFVHKIWELQRDMTSHLTFNGQLSDLLSVDNGVKWGLFCSRHFFKHLCYLFIVSYFSQVLHRNPFADEDLWSGF